MFGSAHCAGSVLAPRILVFSAQRIALVLAQRICHRQLLLAKNPLTQSQTN
jgi:hypothetical protein